MTIPDDGDHHARRARLLAAADGTALTVLALDSIEVAAVAVSVLSDTAVPDEPTGGLWSRLPTVEELVDSPEAARLRALLEPYQPEEEPEDRDDRAKVLEFAASVVAAAFDVARVPRERAEDAAWTLADLHSHIDVLASGQWMDRPNLRPSVIEGGEPYDDFCMRRQNELLASLAGGTDPAGPEIRDSTAQGKDVLRRALLSLTEAGRL